jgi:Mg-chelatase subunit ChlD
MNPEELEQLLQSLSELKELEGDAMSQLLADQAEFTKRLTTIQVDASKLLIDVDDDDDDDVDEQSLIGQPVDEETIVNLVNSGKLDRNTERLLRMAVVGGKFGTTLALKPVTGQITNDTYGSAAAWSDNETIYYQRNLIGDMSDPLAVTATKGLTLHEVAHIMLTPRDGTGLIKQVRTRDLYRAFNALEDQRIEMWLSHRFSNVSDWFIASHARHLLQTRNQQAVAFCLMHGRKFLPAEIRDALEQAYAVPDTLDELKQIIDEYIQINLGDHKNYARAIELIARYDELIAFIPKDGDKPWSPTGWGRVSDPNGHDERRTSRPGGGRVLGKDEQGRPLGKVSDSVRDDAEREPGGSDGNGDGESEPMSDPLGVKDEQDGDGDSDNPSGETGEAGDSTVGNGQGVGVNGSGGMADILNKAIDDVLKAKAQEIQNTIKQYTGDAGLNGKAIKAPSRPDWVQDMRVSPETVQASKAFARDLQQLKAEHDPAWDMRQSNGRLNIQRYVTGGEVDEAFDLWDHGREDAVDIECVILLDNSGSMGSNMEGAYQSMWAIKRALDKMGANTTVVTFSHRIETLYSADERAGTTMKYAGMGNSTEPYRGLLYARSVLANSTRAIKLMITITDGWWGDAASCDEVVRELRAGGVLTALGYISSHSYNSGTVHIDTHGAEVAANITKMPELFQLAKRIVKVGISRNLASVN